MVSGKTNKNDSMTQTGVKETKVQETVVSGESTETITAYFNSLMGSPV